MRIGAGGTRREPQSLLATCRLLFLYFGYIARSRRIFRSTSIRSLHATLIGTLMALPRQCGIFAPHLWDISATVTTAGRIACLAGFVGTCATSRVRGERPLWLAACIAL